MKRGIQTGPAEMPEARKREIAHLGKRVYRALGLSGYARLDLRLTPEGEAWLIEANGNPDLAHDDAVDVELRARGRHAHVDVDGVGHEERVGPQDLDRRGAALDMAQVAEGVARAAVLAHLEVQVRRAQDGDGLSALDALPAAHERRREVIVVRREAVAVDELEPCAAGRTRRRPGARDRARPRAARSDPADHVKPARPTARARRRRQRGSCDASASWTDSRVLLDTLHGGCYARAPWTVRPELRATTPSTACARR